MALLPIALLQIKVHKDKMHNLAIAGQYLAQAAEEGARMAILPEMFCCPYQTSLFPAYAEEEGGPVWKALSSLAAKHKLYLCGGTMPEKDAAGKIYNTSYVFDPQGRQIAKHRKMHLFDIDVKGGQYFKESDTLTPGDSFTVFPTDFGNVGLCICYDFRFPELSRLMTLAGAQVILVPGAFNMTTGPAHWELLFRQRAVDNQIFAVGCAPARDLEGPYTSWGHSLLTSPWGEVIAQLDEKEGLLLQSIHLEQVQSVREQLPLLKHLRQDLYQLAWRKRGS